MGFRKSLFNILRSLLKILKRLLNIISISVILFLFLAMGVYSAILLRINGDMSRSLGEYNRNYAKTLPDACAKLARDKELSENYPEYSAENFEPENVEQNETAPPISVFKCAQCPDLPVFVQSGGIIWKIDLRQGIKEEIGKADSFKLSPTKDLLLFGAHDDSGFGRFTFDNLKFYDVKTGETKDFLADYPVIYGGALEWSPDGKKIIVEEDIDLDHNLSVFDIKTQEKITSFGAKMHYDDYSLNPLWLNPDEIVVEFRDDFVLNFAENDEPTSIAIIDLAGNKRIIKRADQNHNFALLKVMDGKIYVRETTYPVPKSDEQTEISQSILVLNQNGEVIERLTQSSFSMAIDNSREVLKEKLQMGADIIFYIQDSYYLDRDKKWIIFEFSDSMYICGLDANFLQRFLTQP